MRLQDRESGSWTYYQGYKNAGWISGFLRLNPSTPRTIYIQQTNNEGLMIPVHLNKGKTLPSKFTDFSPIKAYCRVVGLLNRETHRQEVRLVGMDFDQPGWSEMPAEAIWATKLPKGVPASTFVPSLFGDPKSISEVVPKDRANIIEIAGHVCGFYLQPTRHLDAGKVIQKQLFMFVQQNDSVFSSIPVRYKGPTCGVLKDAIKIGAPVYVRAQVRVKHIPLPGAVPDENGVLPTYQFMFVDGHAFGQRDPKAAMPRIHVPEAQNWPKWAMELWHGGEDAMRRALAEEARKLRVDPAEEASAMTQPVAAAPVESASVLQALDDVADEVEF